MTQSPRLEEVIRTAMNERLGQVWTAIPATATRYDSAKQTITGKILITSVILDSAGEEHTLEHPSIYNIPVLFPGGHGGSETFRITWPIKAGDNGLFIVSTLPIHNWRKTGKPSSVNLIGSEENRNGLGTSGFFLPGLFTGTSPTTAPTDAIVLHGKTKVGAATGTSPLALKSTLTQFMTILGGVTDPSGACAALHAALVAASWPDAFVATKAEGK